MKNGILFVPQEVVKTSWHKPIKHQSMKRICNVVFTIFDDASGYMDLDTNSSLFTDGISMCNLLYEGLSMQTKCLGTIMPYYTCALYSKNLFICRSITIVIVIVPLRFKKIVWATCSHITSSTCCMFWPPACWASRLHWWPLVECSNALMYLLLISTNVFVPVSLLYSLKINLTTIATSSASIQPF